MTPSVASAAVTLAILSRLARLASAALAAIGLDAELEPRLVGAGVGAAGGVDGEQGLVARDAARVGRGGLAGGEQGQRRGSRATTHDNLLSKERVDDIRCHIASSVNQSRSGAPSGKKAR